MTCLASEINKSLCSDYMRPFLDIKSERIQSGNISQNLTSSEILLNPPFLSHFVSVSEQLLFAFRASDPRVHETTLGRDMNNSGAGRYGQNEFMNKRLLTFCLRLSAFYFPGDFSSRKMSKAILSILIDKELFTDRCFNCCYLFWWLSHADTRLLTASTHVTPGCIMYALYLPLM